MSQAITQDFKIEILNADAQVAVALTAGVTQWDRDFNDEEDSDEEGFLVNENQQDDDFDDGTDDEDESADEEPEYEVDESDSTLILTLPVTSEALADIKALQSMDADERLSVRIIYGNGALVRWFEISPDVALILSSGNRTDAELPLTIQVIADIYDSATYF